MKKVLKERKQKNKEKRLKFNKAQQIKMLKRFQWKELKKKWEEMILVLVEVERSISTVVVKADQNAEYLQKRNE